MNRRLTNMIRFFMDECIPPFIRDSKWFMYPFYYLAYGGKNIQQAMHFKSLVYTFTDQEYDVFYNNLNTISRKRETDLNKESLNYILNNIDPNTKSLIDVGCGNGYLLKKIHKKFPQIELYGFDIKDGQDSSFYRYTKGRIEKMPFADKKFDVVTCSHTVEHLLNIEQSVNELKRITNKQLFVVVPCQRFFYYTLDEHVNFFPYQERLTSVINMKNYECVKIHGDWVYHGRQM